MSTRDYCFIVFIIFWFFLFFSSCVLTSCIVTWSCSAYLHVYHVNLIALMMMMMMMMMMKANRHLVHYDVRK